MSATPNTATTLNLNLNFPPSKPESITTSDAQSLPKEKSETTGQKCIKCGEWKPWDEFPKHKRAAHGIDTRCKVCLKKYRQDLHQLHKTAPPKPNTCDCCGDVTDQLYLDHCHDSVRFRGWLCPRCNQGLSRFKDDIELLKKAIHYLSTT